jgi:anionic cell wall polymer biosynthesis LytR-Cps2A-Psr (LCP) family protein
MPPDLPRRMPSTPRLRRWWQRRVAWHRRPTAPVSAPDAWRDDRDRRGRGHRYRSGLRRWPRRTLIGLVALLILAVLLSVATFAYAFWRYHELRRVTVPGIVSVRAGSPFNVLIVGTSPLGAAGGGRDHHRPSGRQLAEVLMLARVDPKTHVIAMIAIPPETTVSIPSSVGGAATTGPIDTALERGPGSLVQTIDTNFAVPTNDYLSLKLSGVHSVVSALGGIHLALAYPVRDDFSALSIERSGCRVVSGAQAQALFDSRHLYYFAEGSWRADLKGTSSEIARQDAVFAATITSTGGILFDPVELNNLVSSVVANLTIDNAISESRLLSLAETFRGFSRVQLSPRTLPTVSARTSDGRRVVAPDVRPDATMIARFLSLGTTSSPAQILRAVHLRLARGLTVAAGAPRVDETLHAAWNPSPC